ncbi:hypothetical protein ACW9UR_23950 [Halovulum sp. GXIMD14794]
MYYIVKTTYAGPDYSEAPYCDADVVEIRKMPARTNMSDEICVDGWCGTSHDWSVTAYGEYKTLKSARKALLNRFGPARVWKNEKDAIAEGIDWNDDTVEVYKEGQFDLMGREETFDWLYAAAREDVAANTTDAEIEALLDTYEAEANKEGWTLHMEAKEALLEAREEAKADLDEEEDSVE